MPSTSGSYGRQAGKLADKVRVNFKIFKILHRLDYLDFYFVYIGAMLLFYCQKCILVDFSQVKCTLRHVLSA